MSRRDDLDDSELRAFLRTPEMQRRIEEARKAIREGRTRRGMNAGDLLELARQQRNKS